jgi:hypothetical protein
VSDPHSPTLPVRWPVLAGIVAAGIALGLVSAWLTLKNAAAFGSAAGPWRASLLAGSAEADPYTRARVAVGGLLALNREETMYYLAATDSRGRALRSRCHYRIVGTPPKARWWSVTAYADDHYLFEDTRHRYGINGATAVLDAQGRFAVVTGPTAPPAGSVPWLPTPGDRGLLLTLRAYNPDPALQAAPASLEAPLIEPLGDCR